jgi:NUDIX domain
VALRRHGDETPHFPEPYLLWRAGVKRARRDSVQASCTRKALGRTGPIAGYPGSYPADCPTCPEPTGDAPWWPQHRTDLTSEPRRIDYDDPEAPQATSLVPSVNVVVANDADDILMIRRTDNGHWALPGGAVHLGESVTQTAVRKTLEESGPGARSPGSWGSTPTRGT